jgi:hypothetical protein
MAKRKGQTMINKILHRKLKIEQHKPIKSHFYLIHNCNINISSHCHIMYIWINTTSARNLTQYIMIGCENSILHGIS